MEKNNKNRVIKIIGIFLLSISLFMYEVVITRLFSTIVSYHFVFLTISLAILGMGIGGFKVFRAKKNYRVDKLSLILSLSFIINVIMIYKLPYINIFAIYSIISSIPFIVGGMILSTLYLDENEITNKLYFLDLLGAAFGSIVIIYVMNVFGFMMTVFIISMISAVATLLFSIMYKDKVRQISFLMILIIVSLIFENNLLLKLEKNFTSYLTSPITVIEYLRKMGVSDANPTFTKWDSISRTDVIKRNEDEMTIITDGGAATSMAKFSGNLDDVKYLEKDADILPFSIGNNKDTLIIGSGGGKDILYALLAGSESIDAVEINPSTIDAVDYFKDFNGDIYNYKGVNLYIEDGRNFVEKTNKKYDTIFLSMVMTNTVNNGGMSFSENYIYTKNAYARYFDVLKDDGYLSFMFHNVQDMLRGINTGMEALLEIGIEKEKLKDHFVAINTATNSEIANHGDKISMPVIIFKKKPFTDDEIKNLNEVVIEQDRAIINLPKIQYFDIYSLISEGGVSLKDIYKVTPFNIQPTTDNKPFFYDFSKGIPNSLFGLLAIMLIVVLVLFFILKRNKKIMRDSIYFSLIGMGFIMIEIPLVQKSILYLGNPAKAFSYVLFSLLLSCGIGSYFSDRKIFNYRINGKKILFIIIPIISIWSYFLISNVMNDFRDIQDVYKLIIYFIILFPVGFFMGMAFPQGMKNLTDKKLQKHIPLMWGVNGILTVTGSVLSLAASMSLGYTGTIIGGAITYFIIYFIA